MKRRSDEADEPDPEEIGDTEHHSEDTGAAEGDDATVEAEAGVDPTLALSGDPDATLVTDPAPPLPEDAEVERSGGTARQVFAGRFEVVALLGEGGMGRVYRVRDRQIEGREVALKVLRPRFSRNARFRELFFQEIHAAQKFVSEHVNQVRDTGQMEDGRLFLTMDLVEGESLSAVLRREGQLNTRHALEVARQVLLALQSGHEQGFVHRDVKPSNVMLAARVPKTEENPHGVGVRLLDFGIAAMAAEVTEGAISGTPSYMSPEQAQGQRLDARSDLFSVGIVLYEMLTGGRPFRGSTLEEVSSALVDTDVSTKVRELDHLKPSVRRLLHRALAKDREKRFQSAGQFAEAIEGSKAYRLPSGVPAWVGGLLVIAIVAAVGEGWVIFRQFQEISGVRSEMLDQKQRELGDLRSRKDAVIAQKDNELSAKDNELAQKDTKIADLQDKLREEGDDEVRTETDEKLLNQRIASLERAREKLESQLGREVQLRRQLEEKVRARERAAQPVAQAAEGMDLILDFVEAGHGDDALRHYERLDDGGLFGHAEVGGEDFVRAFASAAERLRSYRAAGGGEPNRALLEEAERHARRAEARLEPFETASRAWIDFVLDSGAESAPDRLGRASELLAATRAEVDAELDELREASLERARNIVDGPADQDPSAVIAHGETYGWDELAPFFERLLGHLDRCTPEGRLDLAALEATDVLDGWGSYVDRRPDALAPELAERILWLWRARRWYVEHEDAGTAPALEADARGWRAVLSLQQDVASRLDGAMRRTRTYLDQQERLGATSWVVESWSDVRDENGGVVWELRRRTLTERDGDLQQFEDTVRLALRDGVLYGNDNRRLCDLYDPDARVEAWSPAAERPVPRSRALPHPEEISEFRGGVEAKPVPCLVVTERRTGTERWIAPALGIVREEREDVYALELVHAEP